MSVIFQRGLLALIILCHPLLCATGRGQIVQTVFVRDAAGKSMPGVYCSLILDGDELTDICSTDSSGYCCLQTEEGRAKSRYEVRFYAPGYFESSRQVNPQLPCIAQLCRDTITRTDKPDLSYERCGSICFGDYQPDENVRLSSLPRRVQRRLRRQLIRRVGSSFYEQLYLSGGQVLNLKRWRRVESDWRNYQWTPHTYYLHVAFSDTTKGIGIYESRIVLSARGRIVETIDFPHIAGNREKAVLLPREEARVVAAKTTAIDSTARAEFGFEPGEGIFVWKFSQFCPSCPTSGDMGALGTWRNDHPQTIVYINAHTGQRIH